MRCCPADEAAGAVLEGGVDRLLPLVRVLVVLALLSAAGVQAHEGSHSTSHEAAPAAAHEHGAKVDAEVRPEALASDAPHCPQGSLRCCCTISTCATSASSMAAIDARAALRVRLAAARAPRVMRPERVSDITRVAVAARGSRAPPYRSLA